MEINWFEYVIILGLIVLNAFFAASEISIVTLRKTRVRQLAEEGRKSARSILRLTDNTSRFLATIQVGVTLTSFFASAFGAVSLVKLFENWFRSVDVAFIRDSASTLAFIVVTILIAFLSLVFGELVPKTLAIEAAEPIALAVARPIELLAKVAGPIVAALTGITNFFVRLLGGRRKATMASVSEEEIMSLIETGNEEGVLEKQETQIISRVFEFNDRAVTTIMVPRMDMAALEATATVQQAAQEMIASGYSRYPLYAAGNRDRIVGIAYAKDVLRALVAGTTQAEQPVGNLARVPYFVPESKKVGDLLTELQASHTQIAIVIDEYGGVSGLVTLEDCLEQIVGKIQDEFDIEEESRIQPAGENKYVVDGATTITELNETLDLNIEDDKVDTVGGLILQQLGRVAQVGDAVTIHHTRHVSNSEDLEQDEPQTIELIINMTVEKMDNLRIRRVLMSLQEAQAATS